MLILVFSLVSLEIQDYYDYHGECFSTGCQVGLGVRVRTLMALSLQM